jgi:hypothetical protein
MSILNARVCMGVVAVHALQFVTEVWQCLQGVGKGSSGHAVPPFFGASVTMTLRVAEVPSQTQVLYVYAQSTTS